MLPPHITHCQHYWLHLVPWLLAPLLLCNVAQAQVLIIGSKEFTEQRLLQAITQRYLDHLGYAVDSSPPMLSVPLRRAQELGHVDLYWEYTGTALTVYHRLSAQSLDAPSVYQRVRELDAERGLSWLKPSSVNSGQTLAMRRDHAERLAIYTLTDFTQAIKAGHPFTLGAPKEWLNRADGYPHVQQVYSLEFPRDKIRTLPVNLTYIALAEQEVDAALIYTTDGRIDAFKLLPLVDDQISSPPYQLTPVVRTGTLQEHPKLAEHLNRLSGHLNTQSMINLNRRVDVEHLSIDQVAKEFLHTTGLVSAN